MLISLLKGHRKGHLSAAFVAGEGIFPVFLAVVAGQLDRRRGVKIDYIIQAGGKAG